MMRKIALLIVVLSASGGMLKAQDSKRMLSEANALYRQGQYAKADSMYRLVLPEKKMSAEATYNLGDALYRQQKWDEAANAFKQAAEGTTDTGLQSDAYHNLGNTSFQKEDYKGAVDAYKQALRLNPERDDTRYNLTSAMRQLQQQQQQQQQQQNQDDKNENEDKEEQEKQDQQDQGDKGEDQEDKNEGDGQDKDQGEGSDKQDQNKSGENGEEQEAKPHQISKEDAEKILDALNQKEKNIQQSLQKKKKDDGKSKPIEKDW
ncbi:MAG: tetratricopeptide repeat protein [Cryomorphaceae bacterium]|nr:tetratricopeptide repeat protein [Cryomorphaceae bacterium]